MNSNFVYHKDHIHPKSKFTDKEMKAAGVPNEQIAQFKTEVNGIANLQLLADTLNTDKNNKPFKEWLGATHKEKTDRDHYLTSHRIGLGQSLEFKDFLNFISERKKIIKNLLSSTLGITEDNEQ